MNKLLIRSISGSISGFKSFKTYKTLYSDEVVGYTIGIFLYNIRLACYNIDEVVCSYLRKNE